MNLELTARSYMTIFLTYQAIYNDLLKHDERFKIFIKDQSQPCRVTRDNTLNLSDIRSEGVSNAYLARDNTHKSEYLQQVVQKESQYLIVYMQTFLNAKPFKKRQFMINALKYPHLAISHQLSCDSRLFFVSVKDVLQQMQAAGILLSQSADRYVSQIIRQSYAMTKSTHELTFKAFVLMLNISQFLNAKQQLPVRNVLAELGYEWAECSKKIDLQNIANFAKDFVRTKEDFAVLQQLQVTRNDMLYRFQPLTPSHYNALVAGAKLAFDILSRQMNRRGIVVAYPIE